jgi:DNA-binding LacI/PurR family transcriptional regulator
LRQPVAICRYLRYHFLFAAVKEILLRWFFPDGFNRRMGGFFSVEIRMRDVAEKARVSKTTVSHVLNNTRHVAAATKQRVLDAVQSLGFYKDAHARSLTRGSSDFFGLIISDVQNPFFPEIIKGFETAAVEGGFDILLCATNYDPGRTQAAVRVMIENKVRGVAIMTSQVTPELGEELTSHEIPIVFLDIERARRFRSTILLDYAQGIREATAHLCELGHKDFALIAGTTSHRSSVIYRAAYTTVLNQAGLDASVVVEGNPAVDGGMAAARLLLDSSALPTAVLCQNDLMAIGAIKALHAAAVRVPEEVSVVGCDDIYCAAFIQPPLTTVNLFRGALGKLAFQALQKMIRSKRRNGKKYIGETHLVMRGSTGPVRAPSCPPEAKPIAEIRTNPDSFTVMDKPKNGLPEFPKPEVLTGILLTKSR